MATTDAPLGQRNHWRFQYRSGEVAEAAKRLVDYHKSRIAYWKAEHEKAVKELETASVTIKRYPVTGGEQVQAAVDQRAAYRVNTCEAKIKTHQDDADEYNRWYVALVNQNNLSLTLDVTDIHYFRIGDDLPEEIDDGK